MIRGESAPGAEDAAALLRHALVELAPHDPRSEAHLQAVIAEAVTHPGKLARAQLAFAGARASGLDPEEAVQIACAIEYFHVASLLFDDLPCMDNAEVRRGRPCAHRSHGEASAILGGLALINRAHTLLGGTLARQPIAVRLPALACVDAWLGIGGLAGGQARDLRFHEGPASEPRVLRIAAAKTAPLFNLAVHLPALLRPLTDGENRALRRLCLAWGLIFQALDDLGDVLSTTVASGKSSGRDQPLGRPNLALVIGVQGVRRRLARWLAQSERALQRLAARSPRFAYLRDFHHERMRPAAEAALGHNASAAA